MAFSIFAGSRVPPHSLSQNASQRSKYERLPRCALFTASTNRVSGGGKPTGATTLHSSKNRIRELARWWVGRRSPFPSESQRRCHFALWRSEVATARFACQTRVSKDGDRVPLRGASSPWAYRHFSPKRQLGKLRQGTLMTLFSSVLAGFTDDVGTTESVVNKYVRHVLGGVI